jgi:Holliday junction resolvasome RuvABC endonuclease subunit
MRILGIDPGMLRLGVSAIKLLEDNEIELITYGMISNPRDSGTPYNQYLNAGIAQITNDFPRLLDVTKPQLIASETVPVGRLGMNTELVVGAITACKVIAFQFGIDWVDIGANTVKKEVTGDGKANKTLIRNTILGSFPTIETRHKLLKKEQKAAGEKMVGLPQDVFDSVAVAVAASKVHGTTYTRTKT